MAETKKRVTKKAVAKTPVQKTKEAVKKTATKAVTKTTNTLKTTKAKVVKTLVDKKVNKDIVEATWKKVQLARHKDRPTAYDFIENIFDDFIEFHGDRAFGDDSAIIGGIASLNGRPVTVIGQQKGRDTEENLKRRFGMPNPEGYRKALRLMKQAEKFNRPIITFVDTPGAYPGLEAEMRGQGEAIAKNLFEMSLLEVPTISVVIGEGGSGGALALAVTDEVWMLENAFYSILSPEGFATILWKDAKKAPEAAAMMKSTASDLHKFGIIDKVIKEPEGGIQNNPNKLFESLRKDLNEQIKVLSRKSASSLTKKRYEKFRKLGQYDEVKK